MVMLLHQVSTLTLASSLASPAHPRSDPRPRRQGQSEVQHQPHHLQLPPSRDLCLQEQPLEDVPSHEVPAPELPDQPHHQDLRQQADHQERSCGSRNTPQFHQLDLIDESQNPTQV